VTSDLEAALWRLFRAGQNYRCWTLEGGKMSVQMAARVVTEAVRHVEEVLEREAEPGDDIIYPLKGDPKFVSLAAVRREEREERDCRALADIVELHPFCIATSSGVVPLACLFSTLDAARERIAQVERERDALRAEVEAWREAEDEYASWNESYGRGECIGNLPSRVGLEKARRLRAQNEGGERG
jgi:hypothetical protein